jgi:hypothetical protein
MIMAPYICGDVMQDVSVPAFCLLLNFFPAVIPTSRVRDMLWSRTVSARREARSLGYVTNSCTWFLCRYLRAPQVYRPRSRVVWAAVARRLAEPKARHGRGARVLFYSSSLLCSCSMFWTPVVIPSLCCLDLLWELNVSARREFCYKSSFPTSAIDFAFL